MRLLSAATLIAILFAIVYYIIPWLFPIFQKPKYSKAPAECEPPPEYPAKKYYWGFDLLSRMVKSAKENRMLDEFTNRFDEVSAVQPFDVHTYKAFFIYHSMIWTRDPENLKAVLSTKFKDYVMPPRRKTVMSEYFGNGIFSSDGPEWEASRAMLRPNFKNSEFGDLGFLENHFQALLSRLPTDGSTVDLQLLFPLLTLDSATDLLFGESVNSLEASNEEAAAFADAFECIGEALAVKMRNPISRLEFFRDRKLEKAIDYVRDYCNRFVEEAMRVRREESNNRFDLEKEKARQEGFDVEEEGFSGGRYVFLEELAKTDYGRDKIRVELLSIMVAGRDTTAALLTILWYILARRPDVVRKIQAEIEFLNGEPPTLEQLKNLKYLRWTINETLRLHPIAPMNSRISLVDTVLPTGGGPDGTSPIHVPAGTGVVYSTHAMQRRTDLYGPNAEEFRPERWETLRPGWSYIPFSGGPRVCIGQQLALNESSYVTVRLLQVFGGVESRDERPWKEKLTLFVTSLNGCKVGLVPR